MVDQQVYLLLRYSTSAKKNCIEQHLEVLETIGYCWFGKVGNVPSKRILSAVFSQANPTLVLFKSGAIFECAMTNFTLETPEIGYPSYYTQDGIAPSIWFELHSLVPANPSLLHNSIVCSTNNYVEDAVYHSRIPFMLCQYLDEKNMPKLGINDCRYRKDEFCTCKSCVSYNCLCRQPSRCAKQRR